MGLYLSASNRSGVPHIASGAGLASMVSWCELECVPVGAQEGAWRRCEGGRKRGAHGRHTRAPAATSTVTFCGLLLSVVLLKCGAVCDIRCVSA